MMTQDATPAMSHVIKEINDVSSAEASNASHRQRRRSGTEGDAQLDPITFNTDTFTRITPPRRAQTGIQERDAARVHPATRHEPVGILPCSMAPRSHIASCMLRIKTWGLRPLQARTEFEESSVQRHARSLHGLADARRRPPTQTRSQLISETPPRRACAALRITLVLCFACVVLSVSASRNHLRLRRPPDQRVVHSGRLYVRVILCVCVSVYVYVPARNQPVDHCQNRGRACRGCSSIEAQLSMNSTAKPKCIKCKVLLPLDGVEKLRRQNRPEVQRLRVTSVSFQISFSPPS